MVQTNCGCGTCDFASLVSKGCPKPRREPFMYLDTSSLNQKQKDILLLQLNKDADAIFGQWDQFVYQFSSWIKGNVSLEDYKEIILTLPGMTSARKDVQMFYDRKREIVAATSYLECFMVLSDYWSWFNCSILETIIRNAMGRTQKDSSKLVSSLQLYMDQLHKYCKRNIYECPAPSCMSSTKDTRTFLVLKVTEDQLSNVNMVSAEKIKLFTAELMKSFEIQDYVLNLHAVGSGCVELVYSIPLCIYNELFPLNEDQCKSLPMLGVMKVITKDYCYTKDDVSGILC